MMKWLAALLILFLFLLSFLLAKLTISFNYMHANDNDHLLLEFKAFFGLLRYKKDIPLIKIDDNSPTVVVKEKTERGPGKSSGESTKQFSAEDLLNGLKDTKEFLTHVVKLHIIIKKFLRHVIVKNIEWHSVVGLSDAAHTGMVTGAIWAAKGSLIGIISTYMRLKDVPKINITPNFQQAVSKTRIQCIFQFRIGHAMLAGIRLIKFWKGGRPYFRTKPLSVISSDKTKSV